VLPAPDEPLVHVYAEGETEEGSRELEAELHGIIAEVIDREEIDVRS